MKVVIEKLPDNSEWPPEVKTGFVALSQIADQSENFVLLCAVGLHLLGKDCSKLSVIFTPAASRNPHIITMCNDIAEIFTNAARRLAQ